MKYKSSALLCMLYLLIAFCATCPAFIMLKVRLPCSQCAFNQKQTNKKNEMKDKLSSLNIVHKIEIQNALRTQLSPSCVNKQDIRIHLALAFIRDEEMR